MVASNVHGFSYHLKTLTLKKAIPKVPVRFWTESTTATKKLRGGRERGNRATGLIFNKTRPFITKKQTKLNDGIPPRAVNSPSYKNQKNGGGVRLISSVA